MINIHSMNYLLYDSLLDAEISEFYRKLELAIMTRVF